MEKKKDWFHVDKCIETKGTISHLIAKVFGFFGWSISKSLSDVFNEGYDKFVIDARDMDKKELFDILEKIQTLSLLTFKGGHKSEVFIFLDPFARLNYEPKTKCLTMDKIEDLAKKYWKNIHIGFELI